MHHISKSIYLRQIKIIDSCSASQNLSEKYYMSQSEKGVQVKKYRKKASYFLNCSFAPDKTFRFVLSMHKSIRKTLLHTQELLGVYRFLS